MKRLQSTSRERIQDVPQMTTENCRPRYGDQIMRGVCQLDEWSEELLTPLREAECR